MRISQQRLETQISNINYYTKHKAKITFTQGCGVYLTIDDIEYNHLRKNGTYEGISNREAYEIMDKYSDEIIASYKQMFNK